jgi:TonB family protein
MRKIVEYDKKLRRRLLMLLPISVLLLLVITLSLERTKFVERVLLVGYEGPERFVPEITIIDEAGVESDVTVKQRDAMIANDVLIESESIAEEDIEGDQPSREVIDAGESPALGLSEPEELFRTYASHAKIPYREDYVILKMTKPIYPLYAMENGLEGYVLVEAYVNEQGRVAGAWIRSAYGDESFEESALDAVEEFLFKPAKEAGKPIPFWVSFLIRFELKR